MALVPAGVQLIVEGAQAFQKTLDDAGKAIGDIGSAALKSASGGVKGLAGALAGPLVVGAGAAVGAIAGVGAALNSAMERNQEFRAALGADFDAGAIAAISDDVALLERRFGVALPEQMDAARALVTNGLAPDFQSAMDILNAGFAEGLNVSDDLIDTLREYPVFFANLGFSADDALSILNRGLEAGARNTDVIADAVKEFGILIREPATLKAVNELDAGVGALVGQFQQGKISGEDAFNSIIARIAEIEDPILRNTLGVEVFGTKWEDLGEKAILALGQTGEGLITSAGAADEAASKITSFSEILPRIGDKIAVALGPAADQVLAFVNEHWPAFEAGVDSVIGTVTNLVGALGGNKAALAELPGPLAAVVTGIEDARAAWDAFGATPLGQAVIGGAQEFSAYISGPWAGDVQAGIGVVQGAFDTFAQSEWGQTIQRGAGVVGKYILNEWPADFTAGVGKAQEAFNQFATDIKPITDAIQGAAKVAGDYMLNDFPGDFSAGVDAASTFLAQLPENVTKFFGEIPGRIGGFVGEVKAEAGSVGSAIIDGVKNGITSGVSSVINAARQMATDALNAAKKALGISSPSRLFSDQVGLPIAQGMAGGMLDNVQILIDAARDISSSVLDEAAKLAADLQGVLGPILAESFSAAANFARSRAGGVAALDALFPSNNDLNRRAENLVKLREELVALQRTPTDTSARGGVTTDRDKALRDERASLAEELRDLDAERARFQVTAQQNIDPQKRLQAEEKLIDLNQKRTELIAESAQREREIRDKATADLMKANDAIAKAEADRQKRIQDLTRQLGAETNEYDRQAKAFLEQEQIAIRAQQEIAAAQQQANQIEDPEGRAAFFALRQKQILELAKLEQERAADIDGFRRQSFDRQIELTREAQRFEFQAFEEQQAQRRRQQQQALTEAGDAIKQLRDLVYFSQQDLNGVGSNALRGIADGIIAETANLSATLTASLNEVMAAARAALGIASPSKVSAVLIGAPLAQGIASGFAAEVPAVAASLGAQVTALVQPVASAASIVTNNIRTQSSSTTFSIDARGAAPGVERNIVGAIKQAQNLTGARSDIIRRMA